MKPHCTDPEFVSAMSRWVEGMIKKRHSTDRVKQIHGEIDWLHNELLKLLGDTLRKKHTRQINNLKHQIRHKELELAFLSECK